MASSIDPPRAPLAPVTRVLAEAALQRQNMLLRPGDGGRATAGSPADAVFPGTQPGAGALPPPLPMPMPLPLPAAADRVSLSAQARDSLQNPEERRAGDARSATGAVRSGTGGSDGRSAARTPLGHTSRADAAGAGTEAASAARGAAWPAGGVPAPLRQVLDTLVRQLTAFGPAQRVVAAQAWPAALQDQLGDEATGLPALRTWLVGQGAVQTPEGARPLALALRVPAAWLQDQPPAASTPTAFAAGAAAGMGTGTAQGALSAAFAGRPQALSSGLFALVLQPLEPGGARTSALLSIDLSPWLAAQAATVYGRDPRSADPWLQMAALQASGWRPPDEDDAPQNGRGTPCDTLGCPYAGRAACVQPFCMALRVVPAGAAQAPDDHAPAAAPHDPPPG